MPRSAGTGDALVTNRPMADVTATGRVSVTLPTDTFAHTRADAVVTLTAMRANGAALPGWLSFNPQTGSFEGSPPPGMRGEIAIRVVARDNDGREVVTTFKIVVGAGAGQGQEQGQGQGEGGRPNQGAPGRTGALNDAGFAVVMEEGDAQLGNRLKPAGKRALDAQFRQFGAAGRAQGADRLMQVARHATAQRAAPIARA